MCLILNSRIRPNPGNLYINKMRDPETSTETKLAHFREQLGSLAIVNGPDKLKPPIRSPKVAAKTHNSVSNRTPSTGDCSRAAQIQRRWSFFPTRAGGAAAGGTKQTPGICVCGP
jgi:hypothetical protein